jgi:Ca-activated chloride channel family protein
MVFVSGMSFLWPVMLLLLGLIPLGIGLYLFLQRRRQWFQARFTADNPAGDSRFGLMAGVAQHGPGLRRHVPPALFLISLTILLIALARPQALVRLPRVQGTVILAFDVSAHGGG